MISQAVMQAVFYQRGTYFCSSDWIKIISFLDGNDRDDNVYADCGKTRAAAPKKMARWEKTAAVKLCNHTCLDGQDDNGKDDDFYMIIDIDRWEKEPP